MNLSKVFGLPRGIPANVSIQGTTYHRVGPLIGNEGDSPMVGGMSWYLSEPLTKDEKTRTARAKELDLDKVGHTKLPTTAGSCYELSRTALCFVASPNLINMYICCIVCCLACGQPSLDIIEEHMQQHNQIVQCIEKAQTDGGITDDLHMHMKYAAGESRSQLAAVGDQPYTPYYM